MLLCDGKRLKLSSAKGSESRSILQQETPERLQECHELRCKTQLGTVECDQNTSSTSQDRLRVQSTLYAETLLTSPSVCCSSLEAPLLLGY
ncbi:hypothetical protein EYF80_013117 [Liparis tanakae]|uniref:Uncharacterized protein n=1 Tax=Liparis tanakae TaxID=230148 RepID=A0A4Z2IG81_9TELE|nr:hypothetical protein EYF80_013117 [Liparis tanakae]